MPNTDENLDRQRLLELLLSEKGEIQAARSTVSELKEQCQRLITRDVPQQLVQRMQSSTEAATTLLRDASPNVRAAALFVLSYRPDIELASLTEKVLDAAKHDVDPMVREQAFSILGRMFRRTKNKFIGAFLVNAVESSGEHLSVQSAAYVSLVEVAEERPDAVFDVVSLGDEFDNSLALRIYDGRFRFPDDIDLSLVLQFRSESTPFGDET